jgi:hypothetical protein
MPHEGTLFAFEIDPAECISGRVVRCCEEALAEGPMGCKLRSEFYRDFIACNDEASRDAARALTFVRTSCAMFVRAVRRWCGATSTGRYVPGTPMFTSMGRVGFGHAAFVAHDGTKKPTPGDYFYISSSKPSTDGHTGIFVEELRPNVWRTAEGGGGKDGTVCRFSERTIAGKHFRGSQRRLWGWFDCTRVGLPEPVPGVPLGGQRDLTPRV